MFFSIGNTLLAQLIPEKTIKTSQIKQRVCSLLTKELEAHLLALGKPGNKPEQIFGEPIGGDFTWPGFVVTLTEFQVLTGQKKLANASVQEWIRSYLTQAELQSATTFSQLYLMQAQAYATQTDNGFWTGLSEAQKVDYAESANWLRSYDTLKKAPVNNRPRNYLAVCALTEAFAVQNGFSQTTKNLSMMLNQIIAHLQNNEGFLDDDLGNHGRFDRYNFEFLRFAYQAAHLAKMESEKQKLLPFVQKSARVWWEMFNPKTGHSSPYGRSLQNVWDDTFEQVGFYARYPECAPDSLSNLASAFVLALNVYFKDQYNPEKHLNRMLDEGRGTYSYAGRNRIWSYTFHSLGKLAYAAHELFEALEKAKCMEVRSMPGLKNTNKLIQLSTQKGQQGLWVYRKNGTYFCIPVLGGLKSVAQSDYGPQITGLNPLEFPVSSKASNGMPWFLVNGKWYSPAGRAKSLTLDTVSNAFIIYWSHIYHIESPNADSISMPLKCKFSFENQSNTLSNEWFYVEKNELMIDKIQLKFYINAFHEDENGLFQNLDQKTEIGMHTEASYFQKTTRLGSDKLEKGAFNPINFIKLFQIENPISTISGKSIFTSFIRVL